MDRVKETTKTSTEQVVNRYLNLKPPEAVPTTTPRQSCSFWVRT